MKIKRLLIPSFLGLGLVLLWLVGGNALSAIAAPTSRSVAECDLSPSEGLVGAPSNGTTIIYVDVNATGEAEDGSSWSDAYTDLQDALDAAEDDPDDVEIWVAQGVYTPTSGVGCTATFELASGVALYGGFTGFWNEGISETQRTQRDWVENVTILSGDLDGNDVTDGGIVTDTDNISGSNACHVVTGSGVTETAVLDGFTITAGDARDGNNDGGGGVYNDGGSPTLVNLTFVGNQSSSSYGRGGAIYNGNGSSPTLNRSILVGNSAYYGGGMFNHSSSPTLTNVVFSGNVADYGGGVANDNSTPNLINVTSSGNSVSAGAYGLRNHNESDSVLTNCIFWGGTPQISHGEGATATISYSDIEGSGGSASWNDALGADGGGNIEDDPMFVDASGTDNITGTLDDNLRLQVESPCIDVGTDVSATTDFEGDPRPWDQDPDEALVDMGADEFANCYDLQEPYNGVSVDDIQYMADRWREPADHPPYDLDGDGVTSVLEIMAVASHWGETCP